jgi:3-oxoacyl-[acyl-carrier protein] reductase/bacilysin biosynthesis oxidoreductase BacG
MDLGLEGRVAIVTGGSRGIGRACAASLLEEGARVALVSRDADRLRDARDVLAEAGTVIAVPTELGDDAAVRAMVERTLAELGRIDILINAAATVSPTAFLDLTEERWLDLFEQKLNGYARCLRHVIPVMRAQKSGAIVNISGLAARQPHATTIPVGLNNAAALNLTKSLANELAKDNIRVNAVIPHIIDTDRQDETMREWAAITGQTEAEVRAERVAKIPLGRMGRVEEVGAIVAFLASDRTSFVTGAAWHVDGGVSVAI